MSRSGPLTARASPAQPHVFSPMGRLQGGTISAALDDLCPFLCPPAQAVAGFRPCTCLKQGSRCIHFGWEGQVTSTSAPAGTMSAFALKTFRR